MKKAFIIFWIVILITSSYSQQNLNERLNFLRIRSDIKISEIDKNIIKLEYPDGKVTYKNISDYMPNDEKQIVYSPTFDTTIVDIRTIDTTLYYQKYFYSQTLPIYDEHVIFVADINKNGYPEIYGLPGYGNPYSDKVSCYEANQQGGFTLIYVYNNNISWAITSYDIDKDSNEELLALRKDTHLPKIYQFYKKDNDTSLATNPYFDFSPNEFQQNDFNFGDWDGDTKTDVAFISLNQSINFYEFNPIFQNFDSILTFEHQNIDLVFGGFAIGDFDQDGKIEFFTGGIQGKVLAFENCGNNCYQIIWQGRVETKNAFLCAVTNDLDGNGKKEIWIGGDIYGLDKTIITIFEANGDNSYQVVGRIDILGVFSFYSFRIQAVDVDNDGKEEIMLCLDPAVFIFKFNGSKNHHIYELFYIKFSDLKVAGKPSVYLGATLYDLDNDNLPEIITSLNAIEERVYKTFLFIYRPNFTIKVNEVQNTSPSGYKLYPVYPNPFNPETNIKFDIPELSKTTLKVYNSLGEEIKTLLEEDLLSGSYEIRWKPLDIYGNLLPSGIYFIKFSSGNYIQTTKVVFIK